VPLLKYVNGARVSEYEKNGFAKVFKKLVIDIALKINLLDHQNNYVALQLIAKMSKLFAALFIMLQYPT